MFGTDYPVKTAEEEIERVSALNLTDDEREKIFWSNAAEFFGIRE